MKTVRLTIDSLVLKGFRPEDRHAVAEGLRLELTRLLSEPGTAERLSHIGNAASLKAGQMTLQPGEKRSQIGVRAAATIGRKLIR